MYSHSKLVCLIICLTIMGLSACKHKDKKIHSVEVKKRILVYPDSSWQTLSNYYEHFTFKAKVDYTDRQAVLSFIVNCRIRKDSLIWLSFTGPFGIEVARAVIDVDSVKIWNKIANERSTLPVSSLNKYLPFKPTFYDVQDFLLGNPMLLSAKTPVISEELNSKSFLQDDYLFVVAHKIDVKNYTLSTVLLKDKMEKQQMDATFERYEPIANHTFSSLRDILIQRGDQSIKINADIYKFGSSEKLEFPFW